MYHWKLLFVNNNFIPVYFCILQVILLHLINTTLKYDKGFPGDSQVAHMVRNMPAMRKTWVQSLGWVISRRRAWLPTPYSCLDNPMDRGALQATVHGVAKSRHKWVSNTQNTVIIIKPFGCSILKKNLISFFPLNFNSGIYWFFEVNISPILTPLPLYCELNCFHQEGRFCWFSFLFLFSS